MTLFYVGERVRSLEQIRPKEIYTMVFKNDDRNRTMPWMRIFVYTRPYVANYHGSGCFDAKDELIRFFALESDMPKDDHRLALIQLDGSHGGILPLKNLGLSGKEPERIQLFLEAKETVPEIPEGVRVI